MKIAFVGIKRKYQELAPDYRYYFNRFHLELPWYFARDGHNDVTITTVDYRDEGAWISGPTVENTRNAPQLGFLRCVTEEQFKRDESTKFDVVVHWRKWFPELYRKEAVNVLNCQDHSFFGEWVAAVRGAIEQKKLRGILCFPGWHKRNLAEETGISEEFLFDGVTLGVDTDVYKPSPKKDFHRMLWASDPGRGLLEAIPLALELFKRDPRFRLHVCYPDYSPSMPKIPHPALVWEGNVPNGPRLWDLFNECGVLPYTSNFMEPSSRAHRQAQAAGSLVLYPPDRGTPSELIREHSSGILAPINTWAETIQGVVDGTWANLDLKKLCQRAREIALFENWAVQAQRFNRLIERIR